VASLGKRVEKAAKKVRDDARRRRLEAGESGWGAPLVPDPVVPPAHRPARVAVIGAGRQGGHLAHAAAAIDGAELVAIADLDGERSTALAREVGLDAGRCGPDAATLLAEHPADLVAVATTAPHHVALGRVAKAAGARRILLEKPIDTSYADAAAFVAECQADGVVLGVNYIRRWLADHRAVVAAVDAGQIGPVRIITAQVGAGELAMLASHYVDFARQVLHQEPVSVSAQLRPREGGNQRGDQYDDPTGHLVVRFSDGARAYIDVEDDLPRSDAVVTLRGDHGMIVIEENREVWSLRAQSTRTWTFPMAGQFRPRPIAVRVVHGMLVDDVAACTGADGLAALEVILAAHHSSADGGRAVALPLTDEQRALVVHFP
jgi:predicted dehydrogenase